MQWTKVSNKYAELYFSDASDSVFRTYIRLMLLVSSMEVEPNLNQLFTKLGRRKVQTFLQYIEDKQKELGEGEISLRIIIQKVMEDVESVKNKRNCDKVRKRTSRVTQEIVALEKNKRRTREEYTTINGKKFVKPTAGQVDKYCKELGFDLDIERFLNYQDQRGWLLKSGQHIKDWKATVRTWKQNQEKNRKEEENGKHGGLQEL